jgi:hypothetical protein
MSAFSWRLHDRPSVGHAPGIYGETFRCRRPDLNLLQQEKYHDEKDTDGTDDVGHV